MSAKPHIMVIDPALKVPELECLNTIALHSPLPLTYHLPAMFGFASLLEEDLTAIRGIVILGSASTVNDRQAWQVQLESWLMPILQRRIPTIGFCYGHQMLASMFGGRVEYIFADRTKHKGFREIEMDAAGPWQAQRGALVVSHNEHVASCPPTMRILATSGAISIDALAHKDLPIYSFQPHPEANAAFLANQGIDLPDDPHCFAFGQGLVTDFLNYAASFRTP